MHDAQLNASPWVRRFATQIPKGGLVLDLACGAGRHAIFLADLGYSVLAVDQDVSLIEQNTNSLITSKATNLELDDWPLDGLEFSGIVVTNYLYRPHWDQLPKMLAKGGVLIYETFAQGNAQFGKPSNPNFLLNPGELLNLAARHALKVLAYEDLYVDEPKPAMVQRLCALKER
ncbi:bifunctional 2-polyprenyl-6-hydroxyphenol methylase/3-demethylubiquinol 3-O-methyltransferase UbiG [Polynucleobacter sp. AP-Titi-500A-B4]|uniref:class I SAM-dependent methyltransferase n=1 Tax=Polynucleobacter sp. AP-Titi-500A-B4 TaxID=2576923 RepID=UPI001BFD196E|nr:class I SAM-dependent methyltransferase [Polynucleobacter sp. AP-Titi-500A-B4]QWE13545.1 class I SAM-dependent methyltransferase [Polynucleobacter sp. AP-Titi-500A-B4]